MSIKKQLHEDLLEAGFDREEIKDMNSYELVDEWLIWNGIYGFTRDIINVVFAAYGMDAETKELLSRM